MALKEKALCLYVCALAAEDSGLGHDVTACVEYRGCVKGLVGRGVGGIGGSGETIGVFDLNR